MYPKHILVKAIIMSQYAHLKNLFIISVLYLVKLAHKIRVITMHIITDVIHAPQNNRQFMTHKLKHVKIVL